MTKKKYNTPEILEIAIIEDTQLLAGSITETLINSDVDDESEDFILLAPSMGDF